MLLSAVAAAAIGSFTYLQRTEPAWWARIWYPLRYQAIVRGHAQHYRLDAALLAAVIEQESKFNANARSSTGAIGLMQLLPDTANGIAIHTGGHSCTRYFTPVLFAPQKRMVQNSPAAMAVWLRVVNTDEA